MGVSDLEAVCRSEAQLVLTCLRGNRKFGSLNRSWRELVEGSPIRQLSEWRSNDEATAAELLRPLLQIVRSPEFAGPSTYAALEAAQAVVVALCETAGAVPDLAATLAEVSNAVCDCVFEETNAQMDEATAMQMVAVLSLCATNTVPTEARLQAFAKVLSLWGHYRHSQTLRACAQAALQRMLDFACSEEEPSFVSAVLGQISWELGPSLPTERVLLYLRCLQRLTTHPAARRWAIEEGQQACFFQDTLPVLLLSVGEHFCGSVSVLSLLLPIVNRSCWLCMDHWSPQTPSLGALQVEALVGGVYLRALARATAPLRAPEGTSGLAAEEGAELLVVILEALCDLLRVDTVRALWASFDADWRKPPLLEQLVQSVAELFRDAPGSERPLPAHIVHLSSTVLARVVAAFASLGADSASLGAAGEAELARLREQWRRRELVAQFMVKMEESPKKARTALEKSGMLDFLELPLDLPGSMQDPPFPEWARKLAWVLRCLNHVLPYAAMGEFFGQRTDDAQKAFGAFVDTFDFGPADVDEALRSFLQAFLLPKEGQQIDRVVEIFARTYYRKHVVQAATSGVYLRHPDAAHTLAFSIIMLNTDQHNTKVKRRMTLKDFLSNNRNINAGENIPEGVQMRIFESIRNNEIKTPNSGSLTEGISAARWADFMQLIRRGYRDNSLARLNPGRPVAAAHAQAFLDRMGERIRMTLEHALATDTGAHSDALQGQERLLQLTMQCRCSEVDGVAEGLFFFGAEVFHELQPRAPGGRAVACLRTLFRTALTRLTNMSTKQLHMIVYLMAQFALYGLCDRALPANDALAARLLRAPALVVDPPTGVVYSFLRKISTAPFKMLSYTEEEERSKPKASDGAPQRNSSQVGLPSGSPRNTQPEVDSSAEELQSPEAAAEASEDSFRVDEGAGQDAASADQASQASLHSDPLRPQIERAFESCDLECFIQALVQLWPLKQPEATQVFLSCLSALFLTLRAGAKVNKELELPWWPEPPALTGSAPPQALQLPKRALALHVLDGYEILRLALRLMAVTLEADSPAVPSAAIQDFSLSVHAGLFHTIRRSDLSERTLRMSIAGLFQASATLLRIRSAEGYAVSMGWPVRLIAELLRRAEAEPQFLVPAARLCLESVRAFVIELAPARPLDRLELWKALLLVVLKAVPTPTRALWPGARDREMEGIQNQLWMQGAVWLLGHPQLLECLGVENVAAAGAAAGASAANERSAEGGVFWPWALGELSTLAQDVSAGARPVATRLLLDAYAYLLGSMARSRTAEEYAEEDAEAEGPGQHVAAAERSAAWSRVAISLLSYLGAALGRPCNEEEPQPVPLLKQAMLNVRVPSLLGVAPQGPYWARLVLEKLVASLTSAVSSGAPLSMVREAVSLVAKFFLQNLHTLQRHECFGQLWLMVLRLMLLFIKRGTDDRDTELEEIATETLKNLLCVLLSTGVLIFVAPKRAAASDEEAATANGEVKIWWQMTWDCIEVFLPGFGEDFSKSMLRAEDTEEQAAHASADEPVSVASSVVMEQLPAAEATDAVGSAAVECPVQSESVVEVEPGMSSASPETDADVRTDEESQAVAEEVVQPAPSEGPTQAEVPAQSGVPAQLEAPAQPQEPLDQAQEPSELAEVPAQLEAPTEPQEPPQEPTQQERSMQREASMQPEAQPKAELEAQPEVQPEAQPEAQLAAPLDAPALPEAPSQPEPSSLRREDAQLEAEQRHEDTAAPAQLEDSMQPASAPPEVPEVPLQPEGSAQPEALPVQPEAPPQAEAVGAAADQPAASDAAEEPAKAQPEEPAQPTPAEEPAQPVPEKVKAPRGSHSAKGAEEPGGSAGSELAAVLARRRKAAEARAKADAEAAQAAAVADK